MEKRRLVISLVILTLSAILGAGLIVFGSEEERRSPEASISPEWAELEALLGELKYTWKPAQKARVLLMLALTRTRDLDEIRRMFTEY